MSGSDQVLLSEPAIDGIAIFVSEQSIQSPPVDCSRRRAAFHWSFDMDLVRCRQAIQKGLGDYQVDADLAAAVAQLGWVVRLDVVAVSNQVAGACMDFKQGFVTVRQSAGPGSAAADEAGHVVATERLKVNQGLGCTVVVLVNPRVAYQFTGFDGNPLFKQDHLIRGLRFFLRLEIFGGEISWKLCVYPFDKCRIRRASRHC